MIDHINLPVSNLQISRQFYNATLEVIGKNILVEEDEVVGFGVTNWEFGIEQQPNPSQIHIAFAAQKNIIVEQFYAAAISAGGVCNGKPGYRKQYGDKYCCLYT